MIGFWIAIGGVVLIAGAVAAGIALNRKHQQKEKQHAHLSHVVVPVPYTPPPEIPFDESSLELITAEELERDPEAWHGRSIHLDEMAVGVGFESCTCTGGVWAEISDALRREQDMHRFGYYRVRAAGVWEYPPAGGRFGHMGLYEGVFRIHAIEVLEFTPEPPRATPPGDPVAF